MGCLVCWLFACLLVSLLPCSLACLLTFCEARAVEHQKLNLLTPYGNVWWSFSCSTYLPWFYLSWLRFCFSFVRLLVLLWFALVGLVACFPFVSITVLCLLALLCFASLVRFAFLVCFAMQRYAMLDLVSFTWPGLA